MKGIRPTANIAFAAALALGGSMALAAQAQATSAAIPAQASIGARTSSNIEQIRWGYGWHRGGWGWAPGAIVGGLIVGGVLTAAAISEHRASDAAMRRCASRYRSFDWQSGTYVDGAGEVRVCPYLY